MGIALPGDGAAAASRSLHTSPAPVCPRPVPEYSFDPGAPPRARYRSTHRSQAAPGPERPPRPNPARSRSTHRPPLLSGTRTRTRPGAGTPPGYRSAHEVRFPLRYRSAHLVRTPAVPKQLRVAIPACYRLTHRARSPAPASPPRSPLPPRPGLPAAAPLHNRPSSRGGRLRPRPSTGDSRPGGLRGPLRISPTPCPSLDLPWRLR